MEEHMNIIHVTTLNDPSLFWFLYEKDIPNRSKLSEELKKKYKDSPFTVCTNVEVEKKVLVYYSDEWLRAEIVLTKNTEFVCWLLDYGIFIEVKNVYKMPDLVKDIPPYAKKAKLFGLISVVKEYDFIKCEMQENVVKTWNSAIQQSLNEFLNKPGVTQYFIEKYSFNGVSYGTIYIKIADEGLFDLKDKIIASGFGKYDEKMFSNALFRDDAPELNLRDVYNKTNLSDTQHNFKNSDETDANFSLNLKNEPNKQSSPIVTSVCYKSSGRGFSKTNEKNKNVGNEEIVNKESIVLTTDSLLFCNNSELKSNGRGFSKINKNEAVQNKSSGRGFTKSLQFQVKTRSFNAESDESKFEDCESDSPDLKKSKNSSETDSSSSNKKSVFNRKKIINEIDCCPAGAGNQFFVKPNKSASNNPQKINEDLNNLSIDETEECVPLNCPPGKCKCPTCDKTFDNRIVFEPYDEQKPSPKQGNVTKPSLLFKKPENENTRVVIKSQKKNVSSVTENLLAARILVHSKFIIHPVDDLYTVPFHHEVQQMLRVLRYETPTRVQQYAWPAIMRGQHVFLVGAKGTGKTMGYIPAICTFVLTDIPDLPKVNGPLAVIICPGVKVAENIYRIVNKLINPKKNKNIRLVVPPFKNQHKTEISIGVDILICTPKTLLLLLKEKLISLKRLLYVVLENSKSLFDIFHSEIKILLNVFEDNLIKRKFGQSIQLIVISQQWSKPIEFLAKKLNNTPTICIGAYLEAALYGRADIKIQLVNNSDKPYKVIDILANQSKVYKTVVMYNEVSEIKEALNYLDTHGVEYEFLDGSEPIEQKRAVNRRWINSRSGEHFVLVCNDDVLNTDLALTDANIVIQYSLPPNSWSQFVYRFSAFLDNYTSPLLEGTTRCKMHIFLDGTNTEQFPRMVQFLQRMNCDISETVLNTYNVLVENIETMKRRNNLGVCYNLLQFGSCPDLITTCKGRHYLCEEIDKQLNIPQSGLVKLKILHVVSPVTYFCRLVEHVDAENVPRKLGNSYAFINAKLTKLMKSEDRKLVLEASVGCMCVVEVNGTYERCKVTEITKKGVMQRASRVAVKLIDIGKKINVSALDLYILPEYLRNVPPQAVEVTIANLGPCDKDSAWSGKSHEIVETKIQDKIQDENSNCYFIGRIQLQLHNKLYVDNLILQEIVESKPVNVTINKLNIRSTLTKYNLVENRPHILDKLYTLCKKFNIQLPDYTLPKLIIENKFQQAEPQWAHLENDQEYNEVFFTAAINPDQFYVKLFKNYKALNQLRKDIEMSLNKPFYRTEFPIIEGYCYLAKDPEENTYERVIVNKIEANIATCFFVDYGDHISVPTSELKFLMDKHITQLPFQIIECKLYGIEPIGGKWSSATTDILYDLAFEPDTDLFRFLYVKAMENEKPVHTGLKKYSVILIDNFDCNKIINNLFVDMNFAVKVCNEQIQIDVDAFQLKKGTSADVESDSSSNNHKIEENQDKGIDHKDCGDDTWDFQMFDPQTFMADLLKVSKPSPTLPALPEVPQNKSKDSKTVDNKLPKMKALPAVNYSTPNIVWQQTDTDIKLKIHVIGVTKYELNVIHKKALIFKAECNGKLYKLNMRLYAPVATNLKHYIQGFHVVVNISKEHVDNWPRLVLTTDKMPHIKYNIDALHVEDSDEDGLPIEEIIKNSKETAKVQDDGTFKYEFGSDEDYDESDFDSYESSD